MNLKSESFTEWRVLDTRAASLHEEALLPFAIDELECRQVGKGVQPFLHIWRHRKAFILGLRDRRLKQAREAMLALDNQGYAVAVRNSGGAAVPLDEGVLNISLILPNPAGTTKLHEDFMIMAELIKETVYQLTGTKEVSVGEIKGAYCPGAFDLALGGRKFCGIAQRRQTGAYIVQAFIVIEGSGAKRARLVAEFYKNAGGNGNDKDKDSGYPIVTEQATASIQESFVSVTVEHFVHTFKEIFLANQTVKQLAHNYDGYNKLELSQLIAQMEARYNTD
jgi:octanoyl-[GcvH]:protein N-octanoyltransferase